MRIHEDKCVKCVTVTILLTAVLFQFTDFMKGWWPWGVFTGTNNVREVDDNRTTLEDALNVTSLPNTSIAGVEITSSAARSNMGACSVCMISLCCYLLE